MEDSLPPLEALPSLEECFGNSNALKNDSDFIPAVTTLVMLRINIGNKIEDGSSNKIWSCKYLDLQCDMLMLEEAVAETLAANEMRWCEDNLGNGLPLFARKKILKLTQESLI